jgi:hypothetical protein
VPVRDRLKLLGWQVLCLLVIDRLKLADDRLKLAGDRLKLAGDRLKLAGDRLKLACYMTAGGQQVGLCRL